MTSSCVPHYPFLWREYQLSELWSAHAIDVMHNFGTILEPFRRDQWLKLTKCSGPVFHLTKYLRKAKSSLRIFCFQVLDCVIITNLAYYSNIIIWSDQNDKSKFQIFKRYFRIAEFYLKWMLSPVFVYSGVEYSFE